MKKFKITTAITNGKAGEAIEYDGKIFVKPWFSGQAAGWVRERFADKENRKVHILLVTFDRWYLWYTLNFSEAERLGIGYPKIGAPLYFLIYEKRWHKPENLPYTVGDAYYCAEYLADVEPPDFVKKR